MPGDPVWEDIRRDYETTKLTVNEIYAKHGITKGAMRRHQLDETWTLRAPAAPRKPRPDPSAAGDGAPADAPATGKAKRTLKPTPIAQRRLIMQRLTGAIDTKLQLLERRFAREMAAHEAAEGKATSAADFERDTRNIGLLIKSFEQVIAYDDTHPLGQRISGAAAKSAALAATALADEADRLRRELAERLQRFVESAARAEDRIPRQPEA